MAKKKKRYRPRTTDSFDALASESDRGCVLVGCAIVESALRSQVRLLLRTVFMGRWYKVEVFDCVCDRFLKSTSARYLVEWMWMLGYIDEHRMAAMLELFEFRNAEFAHWSGKVGLDDDHCREKLAILFLKMQKCSPPLGMGGVRKLIDDTADESLSYRKRFEAAITELTMYLTMESYYTFGPRDVPLSKTNDMPFDEWAYLMGLDLTNMGNQSP